MPDKDTIKPQQPGPKPPKSGGSIHHEGGQGSEGDGDSGQIGFGGKKK
jgi:hypothetical protein